MVPQHDQAKVDELIAAALAADRESDERWDQLRRLWCEHDDHAIADRLAELLGSDDPVHRELAADALGQFRIDRAAVDPKRWSVWGPGAGAITDHLLAAAAREADPAVIGSLAIALGRREDDRTIAALAAWAEHEDAGVRESVANALCSRDTDLALATLITLTADPDHDVRDWATFALGLQNDRDTPALRAALVARLDDPHDQTRAEAIEGLAQRGDFRALPALEAAAADLDALDDWMPIASAVAALAARTGHPRLAPLVARARAEGGLELTSLPPGDAAAIAAAYGPHAPAGERPKVTGEPRRGG